MCLCEETAKQEGRERKKEGAEGGEIEESTPKLVSAASQGEVELPLLFKSLRKKGVGLIRGTPE